MKRIVSIALATLLPLLPIGCTVADDGSNITITGDPTSTMLRPVRQDKLVTLDINLYRRTYYTRDAMIIPSGQLNIDDKLSNAFQDPGNEGARFRVRVSIDNYVEEKGRALVDSLRFLDIPVELIRTNSYADYFIQGTKEELEELITLEPAFGYFLWLAPAVRPEGYSVVYSDALSVWLDQAEATDRLNVHLFPAWDTSEPDLITGELWNEERLFTQEQLRELVNAGQVQARAQAVGERYHGENIHVFCSFYGELQGRPVDDRSLQVSAGTQIKIKAIVSCVITKEELLKMAEDPEIRFVMLYASVK